MNLRLLLPLLAGLALTTVSVASAAAKPLSDLVSSDKRRAIVERAQRLARPLPPPALAPDLPQPFNPPGFDQPDPEEVRAAQAAVSAATQAAAAAAAVSIPVAVAGTPAAAKVAAGDRELLAAIAPQIRATGSLLFGGEFQLYIGKNRFKVGDHFTVLFEGSEHELELIAIDRTTFTLRLNQEELTRPIIAGKKP